MRVWSVWLLCLALCGLNSDLSFFMGRGGSRLCPITFHPWGVGDSDGILYSKINCALCPSPVSYHLCFLSAFPRSSSRILSLPGIIGLSDADGACARSCTHSLLSSLHPCLQISWGVQLCLHSGPDSLYKVWPVKSSHLRLRRWRRTMRP